MKKVFCVFLASLVLFLSGITTNAFATDNTEAATSVDNSTAVPMLMQPGTILLYDENAEPVIVAGGYAENDVIPESEPTFPEPHMVEIPADATAEEAYQIELENLMAQQQYEAFMRGDYIVADPPTAYPFMKVVYNETTGSIDNIYYPDDNESSGYSIHNSESEITRSKIQPATVASAEYVTWTWGKKYTNVLTYRPITDCFIGTGCATYYDDTWGNRDNLLKPYDCATKEAYDYSRSEDADVQIRNLDTDEVFTYYQADVGGLPDAIIDIWGLDNIHELAGDNKATSVPNVRYYHVRFSDQAIPTK